MHDKRVDINKKITETKVIDDIQLESDVTIRLGRMPPLQSSPHFAPPGYEKTFPDNTDT